MYPLLKLITILFLYIKMVYTGQYLNSICLYTNTYFGCSCIFYTVLGNIKWVSSNTNIIMIYNIFFSPLENKTCLKMVCANKSIKSMVTLVGILWKWMIGFIILNKLVRFKPIASIYTDMLFFFIVNISLTAATISAALGKQFSTNSHCQASSKYNQWVDVVHQIDTNQVGFCIKMMEVLIQRLVIKQLLFPICQ